MPIKAPLETLSPEKAPVDVNSPGKASVKTVDSITNIGQKEPEMVETARALETGQGENALQVDGSVPDTAGLSAPIQGTESLQQLEEQAAAAADEIEGAVGEDITNKVEGVEGNNQEEIVQEEAPKDEKERTLSKKELKEIAKQEKEQKKKELAEKKKLEKEQKLAAKAQAKADKAAKKNKK